MLEKIGATFRCGADGALFEKIISTKPRRLQLDNPADGGCFPFAATDAGKHCLPIPHWLGSPGNDHPHFPRKLVGDQLMLAHRVLCSIVERYLRGSLPSVNIPIFSTWSGENPHFAAIFKMAGLFTDDKDPRSSVKPDPIVFKEAGLCFEFSACTSVEFQSFLQTSSNFFCGTHGTEQDLVHAQVAAYSLRLRASMMYHEARRMATSPNCSVFNHYHWYIYILTLTLTLFAMAAKKDIYIIQRKVSGGVSVRDTEILIIKLPSEYEKKWDHFSDADLKRVSMGLEPTERSRGSWKFRRINRYTDALAKICNDPANVILGFTGNHYG